MEKGESRARANVWRRANAAGAIGRPEVKAVGFDHPEMLAIW